MAYKSTTVLVTIEVRARLRLIAASLSRLVSSPPEKILFLVLKQVADPDIAEIMDAF